MSVFSAATGTSLEPPATQPGRRRARYGAAIVPEKSAGPMRTLESSEARSSGSGGGSAPLCVDFAGRSDGARPMPSIRGASNICEQRQPMLSGVTPGTAGDDDVVSRLQLTADQPPAAQLPQGEPFGSVDLEILCANGKDRVGVLIEDPLDVPLDRHRLVPE